MWFEFVAVISQFYCHQGRLEWGEHSNSDVSTISAFENADIMIAADVVYAVECIPDLVSSVCKFLSSGFNKLALFATTHRNRITFSLFETELEKKKIVSQYMSQDSLPCVFPCYFNQPRTDVRICILEQGR
jgi:hypothetical protein